MSETATEQPTTEQPTTTQGDPVEESLGEGGKKALQAERDARKAAEQSASELQKQLDAISRANESALEKAQREAKEAHDALPVGIATAFKEAAIKFAGISQEDADLFLTGNDVETLTKQASRLSERTPATGTPKPDPTQGGSGAAAPALNSNALEEALKSKLGIR